MNTHNLISEQHFWHPFFFQSIPQHYLIMSVLETVNSSYRLQIYFSTFAVINWLMSSSQASQGIWWTTYDEEVNDSMTVYNSKQGHNSSKYILFSFAVTKTLTLMVGKLLVHLLPIKAITWETKLPYLKKYAK